MVIVPRESKVRSPSIGINEAQACLPQHTSHLNLYKIEDIRQSESALVVFAQHTVTKTCVVIKKLNSFQDIRYSLETLEKRQQCQLEALRWNRIFTPHVYLGLARFYSVDLRRRTIKIGDIIPNPTRSTLVPYADYALVMKQLQEEKRFDYVLDEEDIPSIKHHIRLLINYVVNMHKYMNESVLFETCGELWGKFERLQKKFEQNLDFLEYALTRSKHSQYIPYSHCFQSQKESILDLLARSYFPSYFNQRIQEQRIKRCHGDLKTPNILITPLGSCRKEDEKEQVSLLDAVDFNPSFSNIDVLSDFAMLVIDIEVRLRASSHGKREKARALASQMIEDYLALTGQQDEVSRAVLTYYLLEKAIVSAGVSIVDDKLPHLSVECLEVARGRLGDLKLHLQ